MWHYSVVLTFVLEKIFRIKKLEIIDSNNNSNTSVIGFCLNNYYISSTIPSTLTYIITSFNPFTSLVRYSYSHFLSQENEA